MEIQKLEITCEEPCEPQLQGLETYIKMMLENERNLNDVFISPTTFYEWITATANRMVFVNVTASEPITPEKIRILVEIKGLLGKSGVAVLQKSLDQVQMILY